MQTLQADVGQALLGGLQSPQPPPAETILTALINELADVPDEFILILDDYHLIRAKAVHDALAFLLEHLPPQMRLIIATRKDPLLPLARLRARGQMTEIRARDLRFTLSEAVEFLNQAMGLGLSGGDVDALEARTEGWIAGLQLAALALQNQDAARASGFIANFAGDDRYVVDYLVDEVLEQRPQGTRDFLLQTSILDRLSGPLCDAVCQASDNGGAQSTLETLEQANLFIVPLDNKRQWYRYHHLFAELLRARLSQSRPELLPELHRRASAWYAAHGSRSEAIGHSLAAQDWERVVQLIDQLVNDVMGGSAYFTTILGWLDALPQDVVRARPRLGIVRAWMLQLMLQAEAAELCLQELENTASGP
ncbi:MAG: helix-turn-helix transcriptional regulator, partial [Delftia sp.]|nr:helix-turn-helix transcriptional regulator [Delftia sp.]